MVSDLRSELQSIYDQHGVLTARIVRDEARPTDHPLHGQVFDLPPDQASEQYYLDNAAKLIRSVRIRYADSDDGPRDVRAFVSVREPERVHASYEPVELVVADELSRRILLRQMEHDWKMFKRRWEWMSEFADIVNGSGGEGAA